MPKYVVGRVDEFPDGSIRSVDVDGRAVAIFNVSGDYYAVRDICPHRGARLSDGTVVGALTAPQPGDYAYDDSQRLVKCPWHGWEFDLSTGQSWCDPIRERVRAYEIQRTSGATLTSDDVRLPGPYVAETFTISVEDEYVVLEA